MTAQNLRLTADETRRFWKFSEEQFRANVRERAWQMAKNLKVKCVQVLGDDGLVMESVTASK